MLRWKREHGLYFKFDRIGSFNLHGQKQPPEVFCKKILQHRCFSAKFAKFLRTPILKNISKRLFLQVNLETSEWRHLTTMFMKFKDTFVFDINFERICSTIYLQNG